MTLRRKTYLIVGASVLGLLGVLYVSSRQLLLRSYAQMEERLVHENVEQAERAIEADINGLAASTGDYATSDDACAFVTAPRQAFIDSNFQPESTARLGVQVVLMLDPAGRVVFQRSYPFETEWREATPDGLVAIARRHEPTVLRSDGYRGMRGVLQLPDGVLLAAIMPIIHGNATGPARGILVMGRWLDTARVQQLRDRTRLNLSLLPLGSADAGFAVPVNLAGDRVVVRRDTNGLSGYCAIASLQGEPALLLRVRVPRDIYAQGQLTVAFFLIAVAMASGPLTLLLMETLVLKRLVTLGRAVDEVGGSGDVSARLAVEGHDEIAGLGHAINGMLARIGSSQAERIDMLAVRRRLTMAVEQSADGVIITGTDGQITYVNEAFQRITGYSSQDVLGQPAEFLCTKAHDAACCDRIWQMVRAGQQWRGELARRRKDGREYTEQLTVSPVRDDDGTIVNFVFVGQDVTERRELETQLRQAQKMEAVGQLAGGVAHDFNNLLTVILGYTEALVAGLPAGEALRGAADAVQRAAERATALTRQLLAFSRRQVLEPRIVDPRETIAGMERLLRRLIGEHVRLRTETDPEVGSVLADPYQLDQIVMNLALNARDAMPKGGDIVISVGDVDFAGPGPDGLPAGPYVKLAVRDTGVGMDEVTRARIFDPFFTTKGPGKGTGLGLSTVYGIVQQSRGGIVVTSAPTHGTTFEVYLPRVMDQAGVAPAADPDGVEMTGRETVLLVEDESGVRLLLQHRLEHLGYTVLDARDGQEAIATMLAYPGRIDLLVTDLMMPGIGGRDVATLVRRQRPEVKVLFMSGYHDDSPASGLGDDADAVLQKPFSPDAVARKVREVLGPAAREAA